MFAKHVTTKLVAAALAVLAMVALDVRPAAAAGSSTVTFSVAAGALSISVPGSASLGSASAGSTLSAPLGPVTVTDSRGSLAASWVASASTTTFTTGGGTSAETIATASVSYASGPATGQSGASLVLVPGQLTTLLASPMSSPVTAFSLVAGVGNNTASWNPTLLINLPAAAVAGNYSGVVTHSVA